MKIRKQGNKTLMNLISQVAEKYNLDPNVAANLLAQAFKTAFLKEYPDNTVDTFVDLENGKIELWRQLKVVTDEYFKKDGFEDEETLIPISQVSKLPKTSRNPDKPKVGDVVFKEVEIESFDSKLANNIQGFFKKLTQNEVGKNICQQWLPYQGKVLEGTVEEIVENKDDRTVKKIIVSLVNPEGSAAKGIILRSDLVWIDGAGGSRVYENLVLGQTYLFYIKEVSEVNVMYPITLSRTDPEIVKYLMAKHISEIAENQVEIRAIARIAGLKTKMLVYSKNPNIDPVGCCIGPQGKRLRIISSELLNEKIDVILWNDDPVQNVINSFVTGKIIGYRLEGENQITLIATLDNLLSCIGKKGSNTKLVYMLTNWKINLKTIQEAKDENLDYVAIDDDKYMNSNKISERIFKMHYKKTKDVLKQFSDNLKTVKNEENDG